MKPQLLFLAASLCAAPSLCGQSPLLRDFERNFFVERLIRIERAYQVAKPKDRIAAQRILAEQRRWVGVDSAAGRRAKELASAFAVLHGRPADHGPTLSRFDFMLYALPELVDPQKTAGERRRFFAMHKFARNPRDTAPDEQIDPGAECIFLTGRGVFGLRKPEELRLRFTLRDAASMATLATTVRGDDKDPRAWLAYALKASMDMKPWVRDLPEGCFFRSFFADLEIYAGSWPEPGGLRSRMPFHVAPGFTKMALRFFEEQAALRKELSPDPVLKASLAVRTAEVVRVLMGDAAKLYSWPCEALREGQGLLERLRRGKRLAPAPKAGREVHGVPSPAGGYEELLVMWRKNEDGRIPRASIIVAPMDFGVHWATSPLGLGIEREELLGHEPGLLAFVPSHGLGYAQTLLKRRFGVEPAVTRLLGVFEGGVALRLELPALKEAVQRLSLIAGEVPSDNELRSGKAESFEVIGAWGFPLPSQLKAMAPMKERLGAAWPEGRFHLDVPEHRSLRDALLRALRP
ncbi:MAG: hypothetical protein CSA62_09875 [Planctomycetota bacterium]|nr:MAG: hypothetical protein CSA62_09875 [Planctomycetota bacterium]